jgi:adenylate kinase family enzyme
MTKKIINIVGAPNAGKSTLSSEIFVALKKRHMNVEHINEYVKQLVWQEKMDKINDQYYLARNQVKILESVVKKVDISICDSPLIISAFYNEYNEENMSNVKRTRKFIFDNISYFETIAENVYIFLERDGNTPYMNVGRIHNEDESNEINHLMKQFLDRNGISYITQKTGQDTQELLKLLCIL